MYTMMRHLKQSALFFLAFAACLAPMTDCRAAANDINIPSTFTHVLLTKQTIASEITKCLPAMSDTMISNIKEKFPQSSAITTMQSADGYFVIADTNGFCIQKSANNHPILATEAFYKTANPSKDVPTDVTEKLYRDIAKLIAQKGTAKVAFVFSNGNAMIVDYSTKDATLLYPHAFKKAGEWESAKIDIRFSDKRMETFDATEYNSQPQKNYLLAHRQQ